MSPEILRATSAVRLLVRVACLALLASHSHPAIGQAAPAAAPRLILVSLDGLMPAYLTAAQSLGLELPHLEWLSRNGARATSVLGVLPTLTFPAHTTLVTGAYPRRHGIETNLLFDPLERNAGGWMWFAEDLRVETLWDRARKVGRTTAAMFWPVTVGATLDWNIPAFWKLGPAGDSLRLLRALSTPGLLNEVEAAVGPYRTSGMSDATRTEIAVHVLLRHRPQLMLLHLFDTDDAQHAHGPGSPEALAAVRAADAAIGRILGALRSSDLLSLTILTVVSDHGFSRIEQTVRPGVVFRREGWVTYSKGRVTDWKATPLVGGGLCGVVLRSPGDEDTLRRVREVFAALAKDPASGIRRIYEREEIQAMGGYKDAALLIEASEGFRMAPGSEGELVVPSKEKGAHGYTPDYPGQRASFLAAGPGVAPGRDLGEIRMIDIAPTLARLIGLSLPQADGRPLGVGIR